MPDIFQILKDEWPVISQAPLLAISIFFLGVFGAWAVLHAIQRERLISRRERIDDLERKLAESEGSRKQLEKSNQQLEQQIESLRSQIREAGVKGASAEPISAPHPEFGCPLQPTRDQTLSWWHMPVWLKIAPGAPSVSYEHCTAALVFLERSPFADRSELTLRCQSDQREGSKEFPLRPGEQPKLLPIAVRTEAPTPEGLFPAYLTDEAYLLHGVRQKVEPGLYRFRVKIRFETTIWQSGVYALRVPEGQTSNGHFILSKEEPEIV